MGRMEVN